MSLFSKKRKPVSSSSSSNAGADVDTHHMTSNGSSSSSSSFSSLTSPKEENGLATNGSGPTPASRHHRTPLPPIPSSTNGHPQQPPQLPSRQPPPRPSTNHPHQQPQPVQQPKLVFHCQQAHGSPTGLISGFTNVKELYEKIAECYDIQSSEVQYSISLLHSFNNLHFHHLSSRASFTSCGMNVRFNYWSPFHDNKIRHWICRKGITECLSFLYSHHSKWLTERTIRTMIGCPCRSSRGATYVPCRTTSVCHREFQLSFMRFFFFLTVPARPPFSLIYRVSSSFIDDLCCANHLAVTSVVIIFYISITDFNAKRRITFLLLPPSTAISLLSSSP